MAEEVERARCFEAKPTRSKEKSSPRDVPHPSGALLYMGHIRNYSMGDVGALSAQGMGRTCSTPWASTLRTACGERRHQVQDETPRPTLNNIDYMTKQLEAHGHSYDWNRGRTCLPEYYSWNQWIFLQIQEGLVFRKEPGQLVRHLRHRSWLTSRWRTVAGDATTLSPQEEPEGSGSIRSRTTLRSSDDIEKRPAGLAQAGALRDELAWPP